MKSKICCYPKINLGLNFFNLDFKSHKHSLKSLFIKYKNDIYYDELLISTDVDKDSINYINCSDEINNCILLNTVNYLKNNNYISNSIFFKIDVIKKIPISAGLGGGSSNAGNFIRWLIDNNLILKDLNYYEIAANLGSDIPFFIYNYDYGLVSGIGELVEKVNLKTKIKINIYYPNIKVSTKEIFNHFSQSKKSQNLNNFNKIINDINNNIIEDQIFNDLSNSTLSLYPELLDIIEKLKINNDKVLISGSGSTIIMLNKEQKIRTRYAPSPTGYFHIGGARTAIFNYLFAKHNNGDFIVRIEDTDIERNVEGGIESQLSNLEWMKIFPDESIKNPGNFAPYIQSEKLERYKSLAYELLNKNLAYRCFCSEEQLEADRQNALDNHQTPKYNRRCLHLSQNEIDEHLKKNTPFVIRLKIQDDHSYGWNDVIRGEIEVPSSAMTDPVILKSNGIAMYNFAVVVDDFDMEITHVLRGEEHISNTPYQIAIRDSLGFNNGIKYGHLSVIIDETGKKLSKRNKTLKQFVEDYKNMGFIPESIDNFLALLGWTPANNQEILNIDELISQFDINNISKSPTFFDFKKLLWIGNEYFKKMDEEKYLYFVKPFIELDKLNSWLTQHIDSILLLFKNQISYATQLNELINEHFLTEYTLSQEELTIINNNLDVVNLFKNKIELLTSFDEKNIVGIINHIKEETGKKGKDLFMPIRLCATNMSHGPELAKMIMFTSKEKVLKNIYKIIK